MGPKPRILVAEDDPAIRDLVRTHLSMAGYDVHTANNGVEAVARALALRPNAMVLDINMPELDGFGVLRALKAQGRGANIAVLVLTARLVTDDVRQAIALGAKDYLTKPFTEAQLMARVGRLLRAPPAPAAPIKPEPLEYRID